MFNVRSLASAFAAAALLLGFAGCSDDGEDKKPVQPECVSEADCKDGFICVAERCVPDEEPEPACDPACGEDAPICDDGVCVVCTATEGCDDGMICDTSVEGGACVGCVENADCEEGNGEVCEDGSCVVPVECTDSEQCGEEAPVCSDGSCVVCTATEGCGEGFVCDTSVAGGACVTCTAGAGCDAGTYCDAGKDACVACLENAHCADDEMCSDGACVARPDCFVSEDCVDDAAPVCDGGVCVTCVSDEHCGKGFVCDSGVTGGACVVCLDDADCAEGEFCTSEKACAPVVNPSADIAAVRAAATGEVELSIGHAYVTYVRPALGTDEAGFFVQGDVAGPAIFVAFGDASADVLVGDEVSFDVTSVASVHGGVKKVATFENLVTHTRENDVSALAADLSTADDVVSNVSGYESRLVTFSGTLVGEMSTSGAGHVAFTLSTVGTPNNGGLKLRMPGSLQDAIELEADCIVSFTGPMWRFTTTAQPSAYAREDFSNIDCASPFVEKAVASSATEVVVHFTRSIDPASVEADGSQFTFGGGLTASAARVEGKTVVVTTDEQTGGQEYVVYVENTVTDTLGKAVGGLGEAEFVGFVDNPPLASLLVNEVQVSGAKDLIELLVTEAGALNGLTVEQNVVGSRVVLATLPSIQVQAGDLIVIHLAPGADVTTETEAKDQFPKATNASHHDGAWDVKGGSTNISYSGHVIAIRNGDAYVDAVPFTHSSNAPPTAFSANVMELQAQGLWLPADCGGTACDTAAKARTVAASWGNTTTVSAQRTPGANTMTAADWTVKTPTFGLPNN